MKIVFEAPDLIVTYNLRRRMMKTNEQILDEMHFLDKDGNEIKNYSLHEMIEVAKQSEYGSVWFSEKGPIQITKEGKLEPLIYFRGVN